MKIRIANRTDAGQMLEIYTPFITHSAVSFETKVPSVKEFAIRMKHYMKTYPWLVCEHDNRIIGYAYASGYRDRKAYQWSCECSVYVRDDFKRRGIAGILYSALLDILRLQGFINVYAVITYPNHRSIKFHEAMGFREFAVFRKVGYKSGKWHDVKWYGLMLSKHRLKPKNPKRFRLIASGSNVERIIAAANKKLEESAGRPGFEPGVFRSRV